VTVATRPVRPGGARIDVYVDAEFWFRRVGDRLVYDDRSSRLCNVDAKVEARYVTDVEKGEKIVRRLATTLSYALESRTPKECSHGPLPAETMFRISLGDREKRVELAHAENHGTDEVVAKPATALQRLAPLLFLSVARHILGVGEHAVRGKNSAMRNYMRRLVHVAKARTASIVAEPFGVKTIE